MPLYSLVLVATHTHENFWISPLPLLNHCHNYFYGERFTLIWFSSMSISTMSSGMVINIIITCVGIPVSAMLCYG